MNKLPFKGQQKEGNLPPELPPTLVTLKQQTVRKGGRRFSPKKHNPNARYFQWQQLASRRTQPTSNITRRHFSYSSPTNLHTKVLTLAKSNCRKDPLNGCQKAGDVFLKHSNTRHPKHPQRLRTKSLDEPCARKGETFFPNISLAHHLSSPNSNHDPEGYGRRFSFAHNKASPRMHTQSTSKDALRKTSRR